MTIGFVFYSVAAAAMSAAGTKLVSRNSLPGLREFALVQLTVLVLDK